MDDRDILQPETLLTRDMRLNVKEAEAGQPLAAYLASRFTYHDHAAWCRLIDEGRVTLNGNPLRCNIRLRSGIASSTTHPAFLSRRWMTRLPWYGRTLICWP